MEEWIKRAAEADPDPFYQIRTRHMMELLEAAKEPQADIANLFAAAYNQGFQRGRNYERNKAKKK